MAFDDTMTEAEFSRPILDSHEEQLLAASRRESNLEVLGLEPSLVSRLLSLFDKRER